MKTGWAGVSIVIDGDLRIFRTGVAVRPKFSEQLMGWCAVISIGDHEEAIDEQAIDELIEHLRLAKRGRYPASIRADSTP